MRLRSPGWLLILVALLLGGCGSKHGAVVGDAPSSAAVTSPPATGSSPLGTKPVVTIPDGPPPPQLVVEDLRVGTGAEAVAGKNVLVQYVGVSWSTRKQFDASWDHGQALPFQLGAGQVIAGWDQGVAGMKVGGRRKLIIPPDLGYGPGGYPPLIGPNETLVFVIDLVAVR